MSKFQTLKLSIVVLLVSSIAQAQLPAKNYADRAAAVSAFESALNQACATIRGLPSAITSRTSGSGDTVCNMAGLSMATPFSDVQGIRDQAVNAVSDVIVTLVQIKNQRPYGPYPTPIDNKMNELWDIKVNLSIAATSFSFSFLNLN